MKTFKISMRTETVLFFRNFFGPFFALVFPFMMLVLYGTIFGNEPTSYFGGRGAMDVSVPSYCGMVIGVTGLMCLPLSISEYSDLKVYKRFDATPAGKSIIMLSQLLINILMTLLGIAILFLGGLLLYSVSIHGNIASVILAFVLSIFTIFSLGFFITAVSPNGKISNILSYTLYFLMLFTSGATIPSETMPEKVKLFASVMPLTHVVELLKKTTGGTAFSEYKYNVLILICFAAVFSILALILYRRKKWN